MFQHIVCACEFVRICLLHYFFFKYSLLAFCIFECIFSKALTIIPIKEIYKPIPRAQTLAVNIYIQKGHNVKISQHTRQRNPLGREGRRSFIGLSKRKRGENVIIMKLSNYL